MKLMCDSIFRRTLTDADARLLGLHALLHRRLGHARRISSPSLFAAVRVPSSSPRLGRRLLRLGRGGGLRSRRRRGRCARRRRGASARPTASPASRRGGGGSSPIAPNEAPSTTRASPTRGAGSDGGGGGGDGGAKCFGRGGGCGCGGHRLASGGGGGGGAGGQAASGGGRGGGGGAAAEEATTARAAATGCGSRSCRLGTAGDGALEAGVVHRLGGDAHALHRPARPEVEVVELLLAAHLVTHHRIVDLVDAWCHQLCCHGAMSWVYWVRVVDGCREAELSLWFPAVRWHEEGLRGRGG